MFYLSHKILNSILPKNFVFVFIYYSCDTIGSAKQFCICIHLPLLLYYWLCQTNWNLYLFTIVVILLALLNNFVFVFIYYSCDTIGSAKQFCICIHLPLLWYYWLCQTNWNLYLFTYWCDTIGSAKQFHIFVPWPLLK